MHKAASLLMLVLLSMSANADDWRNSRGDHPAEYRHQMQIVYSFGIQSGGEELITLSDVSTGEQIDSMRAGGFWQTQLGAIVPIGDSPFSVQLGGGLIYANLTSNINQDKAQFRRTVLEAIPFWNFGRYRLGIGATMHKDPQYHVNFDNGPSHTFEFDDATGVVLEIDAKYDQNLMIGFRATNISYHFGGDELVAQSSDINGNSFGFHVGYAF